MPVSTVNWEAIALWDGFYSGSRCPAKSPVIRDAENTAADFNGRYVGEVTPGGNKTTVHAKGPPADTLLIIRH
jgi:hypothetical protein